MKTVIIGILSIMLLVAACAPAQQADDGVITVGWMGPLSGDAASYGEAVQNGFMLALKEKGTQANVVFEDTKCVGKDAVTGITKLISVDNADIIVGEVCSGATIPSVPVAEQNEVVLLSAVSTSPTLSGVSEYFFRVIPSDALQGAVASQRIFDDGLRRLAVIYTNEEYGLGFNNVLVESFEAAGGTVVSSEAIDRGVVDARTQLTRIKNQNPDVLFIVANSPDTAVAILEQIQDLEIEVQLYGSEALNSGDVIDGAGEAAEGLIVTTVSSGSAGFKDAYEAEYGEPAPLFAAQGYDAGLTVDAAIAAGATSRESFKNVLPTLSVEGSTGTLVFDENNEVAGNYDVVQVENGEFVLLS